MTVSHLRFSPDPIRSHYLIDQADFVACHAFPLLESQDVLGPLAQGGTVLLNTPIAAERLWDELPTRCRQQLLEKQAKLFTIDAYGLARELGLGNRINTIMQAAYFAIAGLMPEDQSLNAIEQAIRTTYGSKGPRIVELNIRAARCARERLTAVPLPAELGDATPAPALVPDDAPDFIKNVTAELLAGRGDNLPVSAIPEDGTWPVGTTKYEKRNIAQQIPDWDPDVCIQCNQCAFVCPHGTIRAKIHDGDSVASPIGFKQTKARGKGLTDYAFTIQVAPEDCTGCGACVHVCPAKAKDAEGKPTGRRAIEMVDQAPIREREVACWDHLLGLETRGLDAVPATTPKGSQLRETRFEFSGACSGCGETPYLKLLSQLTGDHSLIANATGCSSIYGGNLPTTPYTTGPDGRGPAWDNSLFEDNAEFGLGMRLSVDQLQHTAVQLLSSRNDLNDDLKRDLLDGASGGTDQLDAQWACIATLVAQLGDSDADRRLKEVADYLAPKAVWIVGGDGWAYDVGFGGLDHVLASGRNVNVLVLDTGVYSNTGGQSSKATPRAAVAKFAASGKSAPRKDLGAMVMGSGTVYVAQIAYGANPAQTVKAFNEAAAFPGPSLIIAYSHCIAHGIDMRTGTDIQKEAVACGFWPLYRFDPRNAAAGKPLLSLDSREPKGSVEQWATKQGRFRILSQSQPDRAKVLLEDLANDCAQRQAQLKALASV